MFENSKQHAKSENIQTPDEQPGVLGEFFGSAFDAAVVNKVRGVTQLFGAEVSVPKERSLTGMTQLAHIAGTSAGEILDFVILSKIAGAGVNRVSTQFAARNLLAAKLAESAVMRHTVTSAGVGLVNGSLLTPTRPGEEPWRRLGNGITEAATFGTLGGISALQGKALNGPLATRLEANALSGAAAGVVHVQMDAFTHGKVASANDTAEGAVGWAVGNVLISEGIHGVGKSWNLARAIAKSRTEFPFAKRGVSQPEVGASVPSETRVVEPVGPALKEVPLGEVVTPAAKEVPLSEVVTPAAKEVPLSEVVTPTAKEVPLVEPARSEASRPTESDAVFVQPKLDASETLSMRELVRRDSETFAKVLEDYYVKLQKSFPLEGEIESPETYRRYLQGEGTWDMVVLRDESKNVIGGIQYQIIDVAGESVNKAAWGEHIWLAPEARNYPNFRGLINVAKTQIEKAGGDVVFMEFNNPDKMTLAQIAEDSSAGISPADREKIWGRVGIHVPVDRTGNMLEYGQPGMDGQPPVEFLSLGFIGAESLSGKSISKSDYLKLAHKAHSTIEGVDPSVDPTVRGYTEAVQAMKDDSFTFVPLAAIAKAREAALIAREASMVESVVKALTANMTPGLNQALGALVRSQKIASPEAVQPLIPDVLRKALEQALNEGKKPRR